MRKRTDAAPPAAEIGGMLSDFLDDKRLELIDRCKAVVHDRFGVELREEIVFLGEF